MTHSRAGRPAKSSPKADANTGDMCTGQNAKRWQVSGEIDGQRREIRVTANDKDGAMAIAHVDHRMAVKTCREIEI